MKRSLTLAMAMVLGISASAYAANPFSDVPAGHWAYDSVAKLATDGVVDGYADGAFDGNKLMTRYEMAQIVGKAMAKGANVDKLAAEFADELDTLGVRVTKLESKADAVKITGEVRYHYADFERKLMGQKASANQNCLRSRIWVQGAINDDWTYTGMLQNTQDFDNETGDEETKFKRAYVEGKIGGVDILAGRYNAFLVNGNLYDEHADGIELSYGKDVKVAGFYLKPTDQVGFYNLAYGDQSTNRVDGTIELRYDNAYGIKTDATIGAVDITAGYTVFDDGLNGAYDLFGTYAGSLGVQKDNKIWNFGLNFYVAKDLKLIADYMKSNVDRTTYFGKDYVLFDGDDGYVISLNYKGAKASEPGTYGIYANYYDQARSTVIAHTMNGFYGYTGFEGYMVGANYTLAKNIVASLEWYDLKSKSMIVFDEVGRMNKSPKEDMETIWAQVVFTF